MAKKKNQLTAPFPYFGGKRHVASTAWELMGDVQAYVEPFCGSAAVLLGRPPRHTGRREILNDLDGWITNLWRAVRDRPDEVAHHARGPIMELDNHARLAWLKQRAADPSFKDWLAGDPEQCDPKAAAWWLVATIGSIGGGTRRGPWVQRDGYLVRSGEPSVGITRPIPSLGRGSSLADDWAQRLAPLTKRLHRVTITCGDWRRALSTTVFGGYDPVGVFLDPPYGGEYRTPDGGQTLYAAEDHDVAADVREWCLTAPDNARVILCGYDDEHDALLNHGWRKVNPPNHSTPGYNAQNVNVDRDRLWVSPNCLDTSLDAQHALDWESA